MTSHYKDILFEFTEKLSKFKQFEKEKALLELTVHFENGMRLLKEKKLDDALAEFNKDTLANTTTGRSYFNIGLIYSVKGAFDKAVPNYEKSIKLQPVNTPALSNLGLVYLQLKEYKKARVCFEKSLSIDPTQDRIKTDLDKLKRMGY